MEYKSVKGYSGWGQFGVLMAFLCLGFILAGIAQLVIGLKMIPPGTSMMEMGDAMLKAMMDPKNIAMARLSQVLGTFLLLFVPVVLYSLIVNGRNKFWLGFNSYVNGIQILIGFFIIFAAGILASPLEDISKAIVVHFPSLDVMAKKLEAAYLEQVLALSNLKSWPEFLMAVVIMAFFPALFEEVFFRGGVQNLLVKWWKRPLLAIIVTSLLFSLIHMSIYLFLSRALLGFVLGLMFHKTKNIWVNVIAHFLNNAVAVAQLFYMSSRKEKIDLSKLELKIEWWFTLGALIATYFLFWLLTKYSIKNRQKVEAREQQLLAAEDPFRNFGNAENQ